MLNELRAASLPQNLSFEFMQAEEKAMKDALGPTLAYHRILADVAGGVNAGLVLSRLVHLQRKALDQRNGLWFSIRAIDWEQQFALHRRQLENAKQKLCQKGLIEEFLTHDVRKRLYTQVNPLGLLEAIKPILAQSGLLGVQSLNDSTQADGGKQGNRAVQTLNDAAQTEKNPGIQGITDALNVPKSPTEMADLSAVGGKGTLVEAGLVHGERREKDIVYAQARLTTALSTKTTTTTGQTEGVGTNPADVVGVGIDQLFWPTFVTRADRGVHVAPDFGMSGVSRRDGCESSQVSC
jgi:hypothetical protein